MGSCRLISMICVSILTVFAIRAQDVMGSNQNPFHAEASLSIGTRSCHLQPFESGIDFNYMIINKISIHANLNSSFFIEKNGNSQNYNNANNIGGGIGYRFMTNSAKARDVFDIRGYVTATAGHSNYKNTAYKIGIYWYSLKTGQLFVPCIGVGFNLKDFKNVNMPTYKGFYLSIGVRL